MPFGETRFCCTLWDTVHGVDFASRGNLAGLSEVVKFKDCGRDGKLVLIQ